MGYRTRKIGTLVLCLATVVTAIGLPQKAYAAPYFTGGTVVESGGYRIHTFTSGGTLTMVLPGDVEYLVVGGGGGGGRSQSNDAGGGGGAGGMVTGTVTVSANQTITVGAGGAGATSDGNNGQNGGTSSIGSLVSVSGGGGGGNRSTSNGSSGGSGGGGAGSSGGFATGGNGTSGQGNDGGNGNNALFTNNRSGGGGGGKGGNGSNGTSSNGGNGGAGSASSISGSSVTYAGGGGGGKAGSGTAGSGGGSCGGAGGANNGAGSDASPANRGCGGGGSGGSADGGDGSSGVVIVRYLLDTTAPTPNPMTFSSVPALASTTSISMTASTATDAEDSDPVEYFFTFDACSSDGGTGGTNSSWQTSTSYTDTGLQVNKCYGYTVAARDALGNTGATSTVAEAYTAANTPGTPTFSNVTNNTADLTHAENSNPSSNPTTLFAVQASSTDATWNGKYVDGSGDPSDTAVWLSDAALDGLTITDLDGSTAYQFRSKARNQDSIETAFGSYGSLTTDPDETDPPTPDPMTFATAPDDASTTSIDMTATTASDASAPVEYFFAFDACSSNGGTGGTSSSWQTSTSYTNAGLEVNKCYGYTVTARDALGNTGATSTVAEAYTAANTPGTPTFMALTDSTGQLTNDENGNPSSNPATTFAVQILNSSPNDPTWEDKYVDSDGTPSDTAVWLTDAQIDGLVVVGLASGTAYAARVKARNGDNDETAFSTASDESTTIESVTRPIRLLGNIRLRGGVRLR